MLSIYTTNRGHKCTKLWEFHKIERSWLNTLPPAIFHPPLWSDIQMSWFVFEYSNICMLATISAWQLQPMNYIILIVMKKGNISYAIAWLFNYIICMSDFNLLYTLPACCSAQSVSPETHTNLTAVRLGYVPERDIYIYYILLIVYYMLLLSQITIELKLSIFQVVRSHAHQYHSIIGDIT